MADTQIKDIAAEELTPVGTDWLILQKEAGGAGSTKKAKATNLAAQMPVLIGGVLEDLNTLGAAASDGQFIVATAAGAFAYESGATVRASLGLVIGTDVAAAGANTDITSVTLGNTGLQVADTDASHNLTIKPGSNLTAARIFTLLTGDAARTLDISAADVTVSTVGASLIDDATTADMRATLGLGSLATLNSVDTAQIVITSEAQGDILLRGASGWERLGAGTSGQVLQTQGASANPLWADAAGGGLTVNVETLAADKTLTNTDASVQILDPNAAARNVDLPAEEADLAFLIVNSGTAATDDITVRTDAAATVAQIHAGQSVRVISDGTSWFLIQPSAFTSSGTSLRTSFGDGAEVSVDEGTAIGALSISAGVRSSAFGKSSNASALDTTAVGNAASASNSGASAVGRAASAPQAYSFALGYQTTTIRASEIATNIGGSANHRHGRCGYRRSLSTTTPTEIFLAALSNTRFTIQASSIVSFMAHVCARDNTTGNCAVYKFEGAIKRDGSNNTAIVGSVSKTVIAEDDVAFDADITADDTNEALIITVTGASTNATVWSADVSFVEAKP